MKTIHIQPGVTYVGKNGAKRTFIGGLAPFGQVTYRSAGKGPDSPIKAMALKDFAAWAVNTASR